MVMIMSFYKRLRELREDSDLKQREIAEILCCSQRVYSNYERGDLDIPTEVLIKLARHYGTSVDYILNLTNEKRPYISNEASPEKTGEAERKAPKRLL